MRPLRPKFTARYGAAVCNNSLGRRRCPPNPEQDLHSVGGSHIFFTHLTASIELSLFKIVPASSKRYYMEAISIPRIERCVRPCVLTRRQIRGLNFARHLRRLAVRTSCKRYGTLKIDCCIPVLADSNI